MARTVPHEITMVAVGGIDADGLTQIIDIVETSNKNASIFGRRWMKNAEVLKIYTMRPGVPWAYGSTHEVRR